MQYDDHLTVTRLEDGVFDVVVKNVHFVTSDRRETETCTGEGGEGEREREIPSFNDNISEIWASSFPSIPTDCCPHH